MLINRTRRAKSVIIDVIVTFWLFYLFAAGIFQFLVSSSHRFLFDKMATLTTAIDDDHDDEDFLDAESLTAPSTIPSTPLKSSFSSCIISLYILRQADPTDNWKIQAHFGNDLKYIFKTVARLTYPGVSSLNLVDVKHRV
jgi:hypothetical protein